MSLVLDSSITLAWYFRDEQTEASRAILQRVTVEGATVPSVWRFEVANGLQMAVRRKRINVAFRDLAIARLSTLPIRSDPESESNAWSASLQLSERHGLTVYDAAYLELAQRRRIELATLDKQLREAADAALVPVVGM